MPAHVPSFGRNPRGSPDFLAYPVPKACMHVLGTGVPRRLGVTRSASSPKAAQALGCSLTPGLRISFGRVICMARAASVPGLWTLGFVLLCGACVWVSAVLRLGYPLRPATPGWGDGVCVCLRVRSACTPPLLAGVCGVGVCAWARVLTAPRHSWLGCSGLCALVCPLRLYPATPGWGVRCACVCSGSVFGCAPPLLVGVLGCACACVRTPLVPQHSWLGCAVWVCVLGLGFVLRPATPGWGVGFCVFVCALRLYPATSGWGVRCGCVCLDSGLGSAPPLLAGLSGCVWLCACSPLVPRDSWLGCAVCVCVCVLGLGFRVRPANPGWGVGVCVCLCACSACTPPVLAGVCCVGVCAWARVSAPPRHSWLGCWDVRVCVPSPLVSRHSWLGCALWRFVLGLGFRLCPPVLAGVCGVGVCACVCAPLVPRHSWLGGAVRLCVLGLWFQLRPATPGMGVGVCVFACALRLYPATPGWGVRCGRMCLGSGFGCAPPVLVGVCGVGVCAWARVSAAPHLSWLGCWSVCVLVRAPRLYPTTPGWRARCGCVCLGSGFGCAPPLLAGVLGCACLCARSACTPPVLAGVCVLGLGFWLPPASPGWGVGVCVFVCPLRLYPATPGWGARCGRVCLGSGFGCAPPLLAWLLGCACLCARSACTPPLLAGVCVLGLRFWLPPASPGWGVAVCVFVCPLRL